MAYDLFIFDKEVKNILVYQIWLNVGSSYYLLVDDLLIDNLDDLERNLIESVEVEDLDTAKIVEKFKEGVKKCVTT